MHARSAHVSLMGHIMGDGDMSTYQHQNAKARARAANLLLCLRTEPHPFQPGEVGMTNSRAQAGEEEGGGVRSGPGAARTILLFHIISARPSKQPRMVRTFLKVYMELGS